MWKQKFGTIVMALTLVMGAEKTVAGDDAPQSFASKRRLFEQKAQGTVSPPIVRRGQPKAPAIPQPTPEVKAEPMPEPTSEPTPEIKAEPMPEPTPEEKAEPAIEPTAETKKASPWRKGEPTKVIEQKIKTTARAKAEIIPEPAHEIKSPEELGKRTDFIPTDCSTCTKKLCVNPRKMSECMVHCRSKSEASGCMQAKLKVGSETDANYYGSINATKILEGLYKKFPLAKYWLDQSLDNKRPTGDAPINPREESDINAAFQEIETQCRMIGDKVENAIKSRKITTLKEPKLLLSNVKKIQENLIDKISSAKIDRHMKGKTIKELKDSVDNATLEFKNCFNQGEGAFFKAKKENFEAKEKKTCATACSEDKCTKSFYIYRNCLKDCDPKYITKCIKAAQKCPSGDKSQQDTKICKSIHNQHIAKLKEEEEAKLEKR